MQLNKNKKNNTRSAVVKSITLAGNWVQIKSKTINEK